MMMLEISLGHCRVSQQEFQGLLSAGIHSFWLADPLAAYPMIKLDFFACWDTVAQTYQLPTIRDHYIIHSRSILMCASVSTLIGVLDHLL